ncbi:MAG: hypothetical protein D6689_05310 [Deltaproteobacteria bacterium]|nr:MAG: hypothetical protein D6689_05310 [Deltaproteobacteria bacterium]
MSDVIIGIDLGTTNSVVAAVVDGQPQVLADDKGIKIQPSVVSFHPNGSVVVGAAAKQRRIIDPKNTIYSAKRLIGRTFRSTEVQAAAARMPYPIKEGVNEQPVVATRAGEFAIPEISAIILDHMRSIARTTLGTEVDQAVITVPANFTDAQRSATATAGAIAGITVVRVLNEPTAAALAYGRGRTGHQTVAVYDFGGGTFDVSILRLDGDVYQVLSTAGDTFLGGDDIDERLVDAMVQQFLRDTRVDLRGDELAMQRLRAVAEQTKIELSRRSRAVVKVDEIAYGPGGAPLDLTVEISRDEFLAQIADLVDRTFPVCGEAMNAAGVSAVDEVLLVGGTTKMPYVRERVAAFFGRPPRTDVNPDEAVAIGAAIQADALARVLSRGARPTARAASVAPPPPPMAARPAGASVAPPPPPADAIARKIAPPPRATRPRVAPPPARSPEDEPDTIVADDEETTGIRRPPPAGTPLARIAPRPATAPPRATRVAQAVPPPVPAARRADTGEATAVDTQVATHPGAAPAPAGDDTQVATEPGPRAGSAGGLSWDELDHTGIGAPAGAAPLELADVGAPLGGAPESAAAAPRAPVVLDVVPRGIGVGTIAGYCDLLIERHTQVPCDVTRRFATSVDGQTTVELRVCVGDSRRIDENVVLGTLVLDGIPPKPRGQAKISVTFHVDESAMLSVSARDEDTGAEQRATLRILGAQTDEEVTAARERFRELTGVADS